MNFFVFLMFFGKIFCYYGNEKMFNKLLYNYNFNENLKIPFSGNIVDDISQLFFDDLLEYLNEIINEAKSGHINKDCYEDFNSIINNDKTLQHYFVAKILFDSSKNKNDLSAFNECMKRTYKFFNDSRKLNTSYYVISLIKSNKSYEKYSTLFDIDWYLIGICFANIKNCKGEDVFNLFKLLDQKLNFIFNISDSSQILIMNKEDENIYKNIYFNFIPLLIIIIIIFLSFFQKLILKFFNCCFKKKNLKIDDENEDFDNVSNLNERKLYPENLIELKNCFLIKQNFWEIFNLKKMTTEFNNFNGLFYIRGLIGMSMFFLIFGFTFFALINSPVKIYGEIYFYEILTNQFFFIFFIGLRYSPRVLFSCSGYLLFYKIVGFFEENEKNIKNLFIFFFYQFHKFFMLILASFFCRFSLYKFIYLLIQKNPMWRYFNQMFLIRPNFWEFFLSFFGFYNFFTLKNNNRDDQNILDYFWMIYNEIFFFIFGSILIFFGLKFKKRIDYFILIIFFINFGLKIVFSYFNYFFFNLDEKNVYYSTLFYLSIDYGKFMQNPLFNLPFFLIGIFFGSMNYIIQKGIENEFKLDENNNKIFSQEILTKPFLKLPLKITNIQRKMKKILHFLFAAVVLINVILCSIPLIWKFFNDYDLEKLLNEENNEKGHFIEFLKNKFINFIYRIDIEIFVISIHWILFAYYLRGNYFVTDFFGNIFWNIFNKFYFTFILLCNIIILYVFYQSETNINIVFYNIILYGFISGFLIIIFSLFVYVSFELPLKRLMKFIIKNIATNELNIDEIEEDVILNKSDSIILNEN